MYKEHSFGIIPLRFENQAYKVLLIQHKACHWAFPKGHPEKGENPKETAERELFEEVGLKVIEFLPLAPLEEHYSFQRGEERIDKTVTYFPALTDGELRLGRDEINAAKWLFLEKAEEICTFKEAKSLCRKIRKDLKKLTKATIWERRKRKRRQRKTVT